MKIKEMFIIKTMILILVSVSGICQNTFRINGLVADMESEEVLEYAHIGIIGSNLGTVTNSLGEFSLLIPERYHSGTLAISYLGYTSISTPIKSLLNTNERKIFNLTPESINLSEIVVRDNKKSIIEEAIEAIPQNYDLDEMVLDGFWRAQIKDKRSTIQLSESAFEIYRIGEKFNKRDVKMKILKGRISRDSVAFDSLYNMQAGISPPSLFKASFLVGHPLLSKKVLNKHDFELKDVTTYNGHNVFVFEFDRIKSNKKGGYKGTMLIDTESLAFVRISYDLSYNKSDPPKLFNNSKVAGWLTGLSESLFTKIYTELNYVERNGKWYLSHSKYDAAWDLIKTKDNYNEPMTYYADFIVTDIEKENMVLPSSEEFAKNRILERQFEENEIDFWEDYNYLVPDKDFDRIFTEISKKNTMKKSQ